MANIGLIIITVAWIIQFRGTSKKTSKIDPKFVIGYIVGVFFLIWDGFNNGLSTLVILNSFCLLAAMGTYWKLKK